MFKIEIRGGVYDVDTVVNLMDDELREALHSERAWRDEQEFVDAYLVAHEEKFGEEFVVN